MVVMVLSDGKETPSKTLAFRSSDKERIISMMIEFAFLDSCLERRSTALSHYSGIVLVTRGIGITNPRHWDTPNHT
jgi:hypothetical protein